MQRIVLSVISGILLVLCFPKFNLSFIAWISLIPLLDVIRNIPSQKGMLRSAFLFGVLTGIVFYCGLLYWLIPTFTAAGESWTLGLVCLLLLSIYLGIYIGLFCIGVKLFLFAKQDWGSHFVFSAASLWVSLEYIRSHLFTGFPWGVIGYSQWNFLPIIQIADITSVYGVSFLVVVVNATIVQLMTIKNAKLKMLITKLKPEEELRKLFGNTPVFIFKCYGCKEVFFPVEELEGFFSTLNQESVSVNIQVEYLCNYNFATEYIKRHKVEIDNSKGIIVFSCGVGVQTVSAILFETEQIHKVYAGCDTYYINGFQGVTAQRFNCALCGECYLNSTAGICPIVSCSKSLLNGPCGGAKNSKCEISKEVDCAWEKIYNKLMKSGEIYRIIDTVRIRDFSV
ncbi:MAG: methylenetetrahydrofolate reductase C-terminal domain-containing protein [Elusimicrobiota bacterium]|nr:methylenetetrahydrofolate reductase C-terminal domain-containing protein [Elusimicrobiota bacterium]